MQILEPLEIIEGTIEEESSISLERRVKTSIVNNVRYIQEFPAHDKRSRATWNDRHE